MIVCIISVATFIFIPVVHPCSLLNSVLLNFNAAKIKWSNISVPSIVSHLDPSFSDNYKTLHSKIDTITFRCL